MGSPTIFRKESFKATPWKNGGGITHEAVRVPAAGDPFRWRVSVAEVGVSGPFSDFSGYHRHMLLLRGAGVRLEFGNGRFGLLRDIGDFVEFDGSLPTHCELIDGQCVDLNLIVSKTLGTPRVRVADLHSPLRQQAPVGELCVICAVSGRTRIATAGADPIVLAPWDIAVAPAADGAMTLSSDEEGSSSRAFLAEFAD